MTDFDRDDTQQRVIELFNAAHPCIKLDDTADLLVLARIGSHSHGTYIPPEDPTGIDDLDLMGVVLPPTTYLLGLDRFDHWHKQHETLDIVLYSLHKFVHLCLKGNPNVLGLLWLEEEDYIVQHPVFRTLKNYRQLFSAKSVYSSFAGYAKGQLERMTSYSPEIDTEIGVLTKALEDAGWPLQDIMDRRALPMPKGIETDVANNMADRLRLLRARYHSAYMGEKRRGLVKKHGYDTKNAAHLVRLLKMCEEFMRTGILRVRMPTHTVYMLKDIKRGAYSLEGVKALAEDLFSRCRLARDASDLPDRPDYASINQLLTTLTLEEIR